MRGIFRCLFCGERFSAIRCPNCRAPFDLSFDDRRIVREREGGQIQIEDAEREQFEDRDFGRCPQCNERQPARFLLGVMFEAIEERLGVLELLVERLEQRPENRGDPRAFCAPPDCTWTGSYCVCLNNAVGNP